MMSLWKVVDKEEKELKLFVGEYCGTGLWSSSVNIIACDMADAYAILLEYLNQKYHHHDKVYVKSIRRSNLPLLIKENDEDYYATE